MTDPNTMQIGGDHYATEYQVWDFCENNGLGGLEMCAIKYVCRWRQKAGTKDLEKAIHYIDKLIDLHLHRHRVPKGCTPFEEIVKFSSAQNLSTTEDTAVMFLSRWTCLADLQQSRMAVVRLIKDAKEMKNDNTKSS